MLHALEEISWPLDQLKIVAVDNASNDDTGAILKSFQTTLPLTILSCNIRGKNTALNSALHLIEGDLVVFTDDDIIPAKNWLSELVAAAARYPSADLFGGHILPEWPREPPKWILEHVPLGVTFALTEPSMPEGDVDPRFIWGPNMMCRSYLFGGGHRFDERIGPNEGHYIMGSETEFTKRMAMAGANCCFVPSAKVCHIIREHQLSRKWILGRSIRFGRSAYLKFDSADKVSTIFSVPRWILRKIVVLWVRAFLAGSTIGTDASFSYQWQLFHYWGCLIQARMSTTHD